VRANLRGGSLTALTALTVLVSAVGAVGAVPARLAPTDGESTPKDQVPRSKMRGESIDLYNPLKEAGVELRGRGGDTHSKIKKAARKKAGV
jgi:hypothetical protein